MGDFFMKFLIGLIISLLLFFEINVSALELSAKSAVLYEPVTGEIIYQKNSSQRLPMASTTKIATAITVIENCDLNEVVTVSKKASEVEGSSIWLEEGERMTVSDMLYGLMLASGNDAAVALMEHIELKGKDFISLMNQTAKKAGCENTNFENPNGLDSENHYTTAYDLAKLSAYAVKNPVFAEIVKTKKKSISWESSKYNRVLSNHNKLLNMYDGCVGIKTGYTKKDGRCLVSYAKKNGIGLIAVTLNAPDDWNDHKNMLDYGFEKLEMEKIITKSKKFSPLSLSAVDGVSVNIGYEKDYSIPLKDSDNCEIKTVIFRIVPPVNKNDVVGYSQIFLNGRELAKINIISNDSYDLPESKKVIGALGLIFRKLIT